jgi:ribose transport system ATP-binding protein
MSQPRLALRGVHKRYAAPVLTAVDLDLHGGEVVALIGANGAGKSTLTRVLTGVTTPDAGTLWLDGRPYAPRSRRDAEAAGVQIVPQDPSLIGTLTVAEQLFLTRLPRRAGVLDWRRLEALARAALDRVGLADLPPRTPVARLGVARRQLVAIAAALARECRVLLLDEPTAALSHVEAARLLADVRRLRGEGIAILHISHRMEEVLAIADRVAVLRDGRIVETRPADAFTVPEMVAAMTATAMPTASTPARHPPERALRAIGPVALQVERLRKLPAVHDVTLDVHTGEIVGLYGLVGAGRTELLRAIYGADRPDAGRVGRGEGTALIVDSPRQAVRVGIGLVPEDRLADALLAPLSILDNVSLPSLPRFTRRRVLVHRVAETVAVTRAVDALDVQRRSIAQPVAELSGGNQQKVVVARWLLRDCPVLLVDEPTRGVDAATRGVIHAELLRLAGEGRALLVASSELEELMHLSDRIIVLSAGRTSGVFARASWTADEMQAAAFAGHLGRREARAR